VAEMRKVILIMLLAVVSNSAMAEWVKVGESKLITLYSNLDTIRRSDHKVKMWILLDYKTRQSLEGLKPFLSEKVQYDYDCNEEQSRRLAITVYVGNMGSGDVIHTDSHVSEWTPVTPDSMDELSIKYACGKK
jgi:hypothetical protein